MTWVWRFSARLLEEAPDQQHRGQAQRDVEEEGDPPAGAVDDDAADGRAEQADEAPDAAKQALDRARSSIVKMSPMIVMVTGCTAPAPRPCSALERMSCSMFCEAPQQTEPSRKTLQPKSRTGLRP